MPPFYVELGGIEGVTAFTLPLITPPNYRRKFIVATARSAFLRVRRRRRRQGRRMEHYPAECPECARNVNVALVMAVTRRAWATQM